MSKEKLFTCQVQPEKNGERAQVRESGRKNEIVTLKAFQEGRTIYELAQQYFLSVETIKKIVYKK